MSHAPDLAMMTLAAHSREAAGGGGANRPLKLIFDGDSITYFTANPVSAANQWIAANPATAAANLAVAGAKIEGVNSLTSRIAQIAAQASGHDAVLVVFIGANDLSDLGVAAWQSQLLNYLAAVRSQVAGIRIGVGTLIPAKAVNPAYPQYARPNHNAYRAAVNPWLRGQVGTGIDFIVPYGEHPALGVNGAEDGGLFNDGLHPSATGASYMVEVLGAVLGPIVAGAAGNTPAAFTFADFATATTGTQYTSARAVTGMGMGMGAIASSSGAGDFARGTLPAGPEWGTGPVAVMNGDIVTSRVTSAAGAGALVQHTLNLGSRSDIWDITTSAAPATTVWNQPRSVATLKFVDTAGNPHPREVHGPLTGESGYNSSRGAFADKGFAIGTPDKRYFEMKFTAGAAGSNGGPWSVSVGSNNTGNAVRPGGASGNGNQAITYRSDGIIYNNGAQTTGLPTFGPADTIGVAIDCGANRVWFLKNGASINGDPAAGTGGYPLTPYTATHWHAACVCQRNEGHRLNCGQEPFTTPPPAGFVAYG